MIIKMSNWQNDDWSATPYSLELIERLNTKFDAEWWQSGGGIMGIAIQHDGHFFFIGAADEPNVGMDVSLEDGTSLGYGDFGSLEDYSPSQMAKRIWDGIKDGVGVTIYEEENQVTNQYTPEDVPTVLRRMFSDAIKLSESWEADGNKDLDNFEHGKFITESLDEWAYNFANLADEYESLTTSTSRREWRDYWKDYTDDLAIPEDWEDVTYHNDELPCFQFNNYRIWLNAPTLEERRATLTEQGYNPDEEEDWRFQIDQLDKDGCVLDTLDDIAVLRTLDFDEVIKFTAFNFVSKPRV